MRAVLASRIRSILIRGVVVVVAMLVIGCSDDEDVTR